MPGLAESMGFEVAADRIIDGVNQMPLFTGNTAKSAREGFPVYNGDDMFAYKWRNFQICYYEHVNIFDKPKKHNFPRVHNLLRDPKELYGVFGGAETGAQSLTWVLPAVTKEVLKFNATLKAEPPTLLGTPKNRIPRRNKPSTTMY